MKHHSSLGLLFIGVAAMAASLPADATALAAAPNVQFQPSSGSIAIFIDGEPFATFVHQDKTITRPYFAHVKASGGIQVTRNHPPVGGVDLLDHAALHPGIWMAFGDVNKSDYWRLDAAVQFDRFLTEPASKDGYGMFAVRFNYLNQQNPVEVVCKEDFRCEIRALESGRLILWDSTFSSDREFTFGDQEEMGLGLRVATPIRAERQSKIGLPPGAGEIVNSRGDRNEKEIWGNSADWCDYRGEVEGRNVGIAVFPHPDNFRRCWFHARDYGMLVANPFGRHAFGKGEKSSVTIKPGDKLRLRFGVFVHSRPRGQQPEIDAAYERYLKAAAEPVGD